MLVKHIKKTALKHTIYKTVGTFGPVYATSYHVNIHRQTKDMMQT